SGLQIIDISNPSTPTLVGNYDTPNLAQGVQVIGKYAYVTDFDSGLQIIDISNPSTPTFVGTYNTPGKAHRLQIVGKYAYIADDT
ncbi:LVIVD repeat-containing protein, partial [Dolichospermum circinale]|uniref:LVIVD repeat-containing protein n=1 Tax=Dolichospermum circinale TaxID=109265 RepID=UPI0039C5FEE0